MVSQHSDTDAGEYKENSKRRSNDRNGVDRHNICYGAFRSFYNFSQHTTQNTLNTFDPEFRHFGTRGQKYLKVGK